MPGTLAALGQVAPALAMVAAVLLTISGARLARRRDGRTKGVLMIVLAAVLVANVAILTL